MEYAERVSYYDQLYKTNEPNDDVVQIPGAMLGLFDPLTILFMIPLLDGVIYPLYRRIIGKPPSAYVKILARLILLNLVFEVLRRIDFFERRNERKWSLLWMLGRMNP